MAENLALLGAVGAPWAAAVIIFVLGETRDLARTLVGLIAGAVSVISSVSVGVHVAAGAETGYVSLPLLGVRLALAGDRLGVLFAVVAAGLWLLTTVYATGYMSHARDRARFFGFFSVCVGSAIGIALSANLLTLFVFYEALTLATYPLVIHSGTDAALKGGRTYLRYALSGGTVLALGVIWLYALGGGADFTSGGTLPPDLVAAHGPQLTAIFALLIAGLGVKAALFPLHGWLPAAMVAPAPVSALLHAVAVVKAGVFGIARVVLDVYGLETSGAMGVLAPLAAVAGFTLIYASVRALAQDDIKKRLAYSTIGQLSYIVLGLAIGTPIAAAAAVAHIAHHAVLKITMFFTAGVLAEELKIYRVSEMDGVGRRMPLTMVAFSVAALGIIGVPPIAGFVSKWGLGMGGLAHGDVWPAVLLGVSSLLNAAYFMPMLGRAWFGTSSSTWADSEARGSARRFEGDRRMVLPLVVTAAAGLAFGLLAGAEWAPAAWAAATTGAPAALVVPWSADGFGADALSGLLVALAAVVWVASAIASWQRSTCARTRFWVFFALCASGSVALVFAQGPAAFYACFSVMALAAYGLVAHEDTPGTQRAGRSYLAFTLLSEAFLLVGLLIGSFGTEPFAPVLAGSPWRDIGIAALLVAFFVKIGMPGLGPWMPASYRAVPLGAGAAVAGVVSSAGIVGLLRFMPGGVVDLAQWGTLVMTMGLGAAIYGVVAGVVQQDPRHVLAYSSMSQFGLMTIGVGAGLATAQVWPAAVAAVGTYVVHHGFAKAALFAGSDLSETAGSRRNLLLGLALPSLALAGLPLTSGAIAKVALKGVAADAPGQWAHLLESALPVAAVGTMLLMARFMYLTFRRGAVNGAPTTLVVRRVLAFCALLLFTGVFLWVVDYYPARYAAEKSLSAHYAWVLTWPVVLGVALSAVAYVLRARIIRFIGAVPPGDLWAPALARADSAWVNYQTRLASSESGAGTEASRDGSGSAWADRASRIERLAIGWPFASVAIVIFGLIVLVLAR